MGAEQVYPEREAKFQRRTVYFRESTDIEIREHPDEPAERRYSARPVDMPECEGRGYTQEGASLEAERLLKAEMGKRFREVGDRG